MPAPETRVKSLTSTQTTFDALDRGQEFSEANIIGLRAPPCLPCTKEEEADLYRKVLLAYDGSIEGRRALREGARLAQFCGADVFLLAVVQTSRTASFEGGVLISMSEQTAAYEAILKEGVERLKTMGFSPTARLGMGDSGKEIAGVAEEIGANLVVVGYRPTGPLARWWFGSVGAYLIEHLECSVLVARTEIGDDQFAQLLTAPVAQA